MAFDPWVFCFVFFGAAVLLTVIFIVVRSGEHNRRIIQRSVDRAARLRKQRVDLEAAEAAQEKSRRNAQNAEAESLRTALERAEAAGREAKAVAEKERIARERAERNAAEIDDLSRATNLPKEQLDQLLRLGVSRRTVRGRALTVHLVSQEAGFLNVVWFVHSEQVNWAVRVVGHLGTREVINEYSSPGEWKYRLEPGHRYSLTFDVLDNDRTLDKGLRISFYMPTADDLRTVAGGGGSASAAWDAKVEEEIEWEKAQKETVAKAEAAGLDKNATRRVISKIISQRQEESHEGRKKNGAR